MNIIAEFRNESICDIFKACPFSHLFHMMTPNYRCNYKHNILLQNCDVKKSKTVITSGKTMIIQKAGNKKTALNLSSPLFFINLVNPITLAYDPKAHAVHPDKLLLPLVGGGQTQLPEGRLGQTPRHAPKRTHNATQHFTGTPHVCWRNNGYASS